MTNDGWYAIKPNQAMILASKVGNFNDLNSFSHMIYAP